MAQVKTKFRCNSVTSHSWGNKAVQAKQAKLKAVYGGDKNSEDNQFSIATPNGEIDVTVSNPATMDFLEPGINYYVYFEKCEDQS